LTAQLNACVAAIKSTTAKGQTEQSKQTM